MLTRKGNADGQCGVCDGPVSEFNLNKFYCSEKCRETARKFYTEQDRGYGDEE